ncbi:MAG: ribonuclease III [Tannerella sp.]|jgi:ribonuclease-3|nr:ribonuclease III [Tannerella sp.]
MLGFYPGNIQLYRQAFTHRSTFIETEHGQWKNNERLEFLGDAVLNAVVADIIYKKYPNRKEGFLTNTRSKIVQRESLNRIAHEMGLDKMIIVSSRLNSHNSYIYGNAFEALIGAIYLDQGYRKCCRFVEEQIIEKYIPLDKIAHKEFNFKSNLIEWSQKNKLEVSFELIETFADQNGSPVFQSRVSLPGISLGTGIGYTKKESQQSAAKKAIKKIRRDKDVQLLISKLKQQQSSDGTGNVSLPECPEGDDSTKDERNDRQ